MPAAPVAKDMTKLSLEPVETIDIKNSVTPN